MTSFCPLHIYIKYTLYSTYIIVLGIICRFWQGLVGCGAAGVASLEETRGWAGHSRFSRIQPAPRPPLQGTAAPTRGVWGASVPTRCAPVKTYLRKGTRRPEEKERGDLTEGGQREEHDWAEAAAEAVAWAGPGARVSTRAGAERWDPKGTVGTTGHWPDLLPCPCLTKESVVFGENKTKKARVWGGVQREAAEFFLRVFLLLFFFSTRINN